jgi:hypothetical protein
MGRPSIVPHSFSSFSPEIFSSILLLRLNNVKLIPDAGIIITAWNSVHGQKALWACLQEAIAYNSPHL